MGDGRRARRAKQVRRDKRRAKMRSVKGSADTTLSDAIRRALGRHPLGLLSMASMVMHVANPESIASLECGTNYLGQILTSLTDTRSRETSALLAVIGELLVDDPEPQLRCRRVVAERGESLPRWISALPEVDVYRAVRRTHVFGDVEEIVIGMRLDGGHELTIAARIDHNMLSSIVDAGAVPDPIDAALLKVAETSTDTSVLEVTPEDARAWIEDALSKPTMAPQTEAWPLYRSLVRWLVNRLPEGGEHRSPAGEPESNEKLCDAFFATSSAAPFTDLGHRELLLELFESGTGDPLRWSATRVEHAIGGTGLPYFEYSIPLEVVLDAPDLLRAFIPFAHAQSGIRDELTSRTLAAIDALRSGYKRQVLRRADYWWLDDAV